MFNNYFRSPIIFAFILLLLISIPNVLWAENDNINENHVVKDEYITKADLSELIYSLKKDSSSNLSETDVYKALLQTKDDKISLLQGNISTIIQFVALIIAILTVVIALMNNKIDTKLKLVSSLDYTVAKINDEIEDIKKKIKISLKDADNLQQKSWQIYYKFNPNIKEQFKNDYNNEKQEVVNQETKKYAESDITAFTFLRGQIYYADLGKMMGSEIAGQRPIIIVGNDITNKYSRTLTVVPLTSQFKEPKSPTHVKIELIKPGVALIEQIRTIDKKRIMTFITSLDDITMSEVNSAIEIHLGLK